MEPEFLIIGINPDLQVISLCVAPALYCFKGGSVD